MQSRTSIPQMLLAWCIVVILAVHASPALAHAGHSHTDEGLGIATTLQVAATVAVLGASVLVANRFFRERDEHHKSTRDITSRRRR